MQSKVGAVGQWWWAAMFATMCMFSDGPAQARSLAPSPIRDDARVSIEWRAPASCPRELQFEAMVDSMLPNRLDMPRARASSFEVVIRRMSTGQWVAKLASRGEGPPHVRTIAMHDGHGGCMALARAVALVVAIAIDPDARDLLETRTRGFADGPVTGDVAEKLSPPAPVAQPLSNDVVRTVSRPNSRRASRDRRRPPTRTRRRTRFGFGLAVGTGIGIAHGYAEHTRHQYFGRGLDAPGYGSGRAACAAARWAARGGPLPSERQLFGASADDVPANSIFGALATDEAQASDWARSFDADVCEDHHPLTLSMASAPLHLVPDIDVKLSKRVQLGLMARLAVVDGARLAESQWVSSPLDIPDDALTFQSTSMAWAILVRLRVVLGDPFRRIRPYVGLVSGFGIARLRVDLGFSDDLDGNSVPDDHEPIDRESGCGSGVFPYASGCSEADLERGRAMRELAQARPNRVDTLRLGPFMIGALAGLSVDIVGPLGMYAELQFGGWFPFPSTLLIDLNVGPTLYF